MTIPKSPPKKILVIRLSALGDLVMCAQAFHEIRVAHPHAKIALLTMPAFAPFARLMPWFDEVLVDTRPPFAKPLDWWRLRQSIARFAPDLVIDLQAKFRQSILYILLGGPFGPRWSGAAPLCALPRPWPPEPGMHYTDFVAAHLRAAGVPPASPVSFDWLAAPLGDLQLPPRYAVLIVGCSPGREYKRWPPVHFAAVAQKLAARDVTPVVVGTKAESAEAEVIVAAEPRTLNLLQKTSLPQLASVLRGATFVLGNDTGPTHLAAALGVPTLALISGRVNAVWNHPKGAKAHWLQHEPLADLSVQTVLGKLVDENMG